MELNLKRLSKHPEQNSILGQLGIDGAYFCYTLENLRLMIPAGRYEVLPYSSPHFHCVVPMVTGIPEREDIEIHPGNTCADTHGCICVGYRIGDGIIQGGTSKAAFDHLMDTLQSGWVDDVWITVEDPPTDPSGKSASGGKTATG